MKPVIEENAQPIKLSDDPIKALEEIADYLKAINYSKEREVVEDDEGEPFIVGFIQTPEYLQGCVDIVHECRRIVAQEKAKGTDNER